MREHPVSAGFRGGPVLAWPLAVLCLVLALPLPPAAAGEGEPEPVPFSSFQVDQSALRLLGAEHGILLMGYDVEWWKEMEEPLTAKFLSRMAKIHRALGISATLFPVGNGFELNRKAYERLAKDPLFEIAQHTFEHSRLKSVVQKNEEGVTFFPAPSLAEIERSVTRASQVIGMRLGAPPIGLTAPYCYYRGLSDRPDVLAILRQAGLRYVRSWGRDANDWQPLPMSVQPFWYAPQGYPDILEIPIQGWQDCLWRERNGWAEKEGYLAVVRSEIDEAAAGNLVFSYDQHDWTSLREDPEMDLTRKILEYAKERGMTFATHAAFYRAALEAREKSAGAPRPPPPSPSPPSSPSSPK